MTSDGMVTSQMVLRALTQVQRDRGKLAAEQLEQQEPDLAEFVFEQLTDLQHRLWNAGLDDARARELGRLCQEIVFTALLATRQAHSEAWNEVAGLDRGDRGNAGDGS